MSNYSYLELAAFPAIGAVTMGVLRPDLRRPLIALAVSGAIWGPVSEHWFLSDYWRPSGVFGNPWLEDILFGAGLAAFSAGVFLLFTKRVMSCEPVQGAHWAAVAMFPIIYVAMISALQGVLHVNSIVVSVAIYVGLAIFMLLRRRDLLVLSLATGAIMGAIALIGYAIGLDVVLDGQALLRTIWLVDGTPLGVTVLGNVPVTEVVWFACWGAFFGIVYEYVTGAVIGRGHAQKASP